MAKRKAAVNDIIYELDNDDIEISSDDDIKEPKINRLEVNTSQNSTPNDQNTQESRTSIISLDSSFEIGGEIVSSSNLDNGGKTACDLVLVEDGPNTTPKQTEVVVDIGKKLSPGCPKTTIYNEDIVIDSPASNSDLGVVGCENRTPLVTVRFRDSKLAMNYKKKIKAFMMNLIRLHNSDSMESDHETDLELDIWPEDLNEEEFEEDIEKVEDTLFFVDTDPCANSQEEVPRYSQNLSLLSDIPNSEPIPPAFTRRGPICFNCEGNHPLRECPFPRDNARIAEKRKNTIRMGRYHVEDEQKYGHLVPGRISGHLRHALGLKRHELPLHIYRMRLLGYPPGWLEEARISHSGITMFDSTGNAILDPEEEEGEVCEPGSKDKFDIKKILDFPGFNVPASPRYLEEAHLFNLPPMSDEDSKMTMLQMLAPNAMKAYKRKKLTFFPSAVTAATHVEQAEMELDSGDEVAEFPSIPPLPDDAPPPPLPPPPPPPASPPPPPPATPPPPPAASSLPPEETDTERKSTDKIAKDDDKASIEDDDVEIIEVMKVGDIPVPMVDLITIDEDYEQSQPSSARESPSLDDLEEKKQLLLNALKGDTISIDISTEDETIVHDISNEVDSETDPEKKMEADKKTEADENTELTNNDKIEVNDQKETIDSKEVIKCDTKEPEIESTLPDNNKVGMEKCIATDSDPDIKTPDTKTGQVKTTLFGTPVMNIASPYMKLPSDDKFAKDICDVINFENLPNSTGKYKQISTLLKKVKSEVDRIQDS